MLGLKLNHVSKRGHWCFVVFMLRTGGLYQTDKTITVFRPCTVYSYMGAQVNSSAIANIGSLIQTLHSNSRVWGSRCIFNRFGYMIWRLKAILTKMITLHNGLYDKFEPYIVHTFIGFELGIYRVFILPNLKCIYAFFRCCDHSYKCLFLVIRLAEVLLNFSVSIVCRTHILCNHLKISSLLLALFTFKDSGTIINPAEIRWVSGNVCLVSRGLVLLTEIS